ncbi:uracil-DNA glycosylase [Enterococcus sp.]|uniref:uracil-DNA glycosylase n=1 Tax=Enterococcus sp. TaxID=35783 RepID=UPI00289E42A1|nr:uracil-DNA glycosylase [Enterococcus sp.]
MNQSLPQDWQERLAASFAQPYYQELQHFLDNEYETHTVYPPRDQIFAALQYTPFEQVKVVILGQDPYHGPNQAHGLAFSVRPGVKLPPSLRNIYQELADDLKVTPPIDGYLVPWAKQGVFLLNTVLTVRAGEANSHHGRGWEKLTDTIIETLNQRAQPVIFVLWGKPAQKKIHLLDTDKHIVLTAPHPSPLSAYRGFFGSKPFSTINAALRDLGETPIAWTSHDK